MYLQDGAFYSRVLHKELSGSQIVQEDHGGDEGDTGADEWDLWARHSTEKQGTGHFMFGSRVVWFSLLERVTQPNNFSGSYSALRWRKGGGHFRRLQKSDRGDAQGAACLLLQEPAAKGQPTRKTWKRQWCETVESVAKRHSKVNKWQHPREFLWMRRFIWSVDRCESWIFMECVFEALLTYIRTPRQRFARLQKLASQK